MTDNSGLFGDAVIFSYTRAQALEDGVLVDVTSTAKEMGYKWPVAVNDTVWAVIQAEPDPSGVLWDVLWMAFCEIRRQKGGTELLFDVIIGRTTQTFKLVSGPGDDAEPVMTIMGRHDD